ncbi:hypothetical protein V1387_12275 [Allomuricauda taeanensis]|uniref:hypothetical protein n=1 Tax=Flagellimonas taeanensis TaxID=1005926 RepID=UPI002E7B3E98|nr:hypothetical protein [Allomuricauda taeanensis]MEE1963465.1 hypothetical protein [Allomuricauda taeanensis]
MLINEICQLAENFDISETEQNSIILIGSNYDISSLEEINDKNSDIDILVLTDSNSYQFSIDYKDTRLDFTYVNHFEIIELFLAAINGNPFASKVISGLNDPFTILKTGNEEKLYLITSIIKELHNIFSKSVIPDHSLNFLFLNNIYVNQQDLNIQDPLKFIFAGDRVSSLILDYTFKLIFPYSAMGAFRGQIISIVLPNLVNKIKITEDEGEKVYTNKKIVEACRLKFAPFVKHSYVAFECEKELLNDINLGKYESFYFGYNNLDSEKPAIFISEDEVKSKLYFTKKRKINISSIVPCFSDCQYYKYINLLTIISKTYINSKSEEKLNIFLQFYNSFCDYGLQECIDLSLKAIIVKKTILKTKKDNRTMGLPDFKKWLSVLDVSLPKEDRKDALSLKNIEFLTIINFIINSEDEIETNIKANYVLFGIMKSLRIDIDDLLFI